MSKFHVIGINHAGKLDELLCGDEKGDVLHEALEFIEGYRQLFLVSDSANVRELVFTPSAKGVIEDTGDYMPLVHDLDLDAPL